MGFIIEIAWKEQAILPIKISLTDRLARVHKYETAFGDDQGG